MIIAFALFFSVYIPLVTSFKHCKIKTSLNDEVIMSNVSIDTERFYPNPYKCQESKINQAEIQKHGQALLEILQRRLREERMDISDYSVYTGTTGIALLYWHLSRLFQSEKYFEAAMSMIEPAIGQLKGRRMSFMCGDAGPLALAIVMHKSTDDPKTKASHVSKLLNLQKLYFDKADDVANEILYGRAGYLYSLLFVNQYSPGTIEPAFISKIVHTLVKVGKQTGSNVLHYEWHEKCYLGAAHGIVGIIHLLLYAKEILTQDDELYVKSTLDWLLTQTFPSGNMRSSLGSRDDRLVHWCHGAPGAIHLFLKAHQIYHDSRYLDAATRSAEVIWERGVLKRSYSLCHGVAGNAYGLMAMYHHTGNALYQQQAHQFAHWCFTYGTKNSRNPDRPLSLFEGLAGVVYMLHDFGNDSSKHGFPAFDV